jgi:hypothetical protein
VREGARHDHVEPVVELREIPLNGLRSRLHEIAADTITASVQRVHGVHAARRVDKRNSEAVALHPNAAKAAGNDSREGSLTRIAISNGITEEAWNRRAVGCYSACT